MQQYSVRQKGFGAVELIVVIVVLALVAVGGWYVWQANQKSQSATNNQPSAQSDTYANWKTYCDEVHNVCFKHPSDWKVDVGGNDSYRTVRIISPSQKVAVMYNNPAPSGDGEAPFRTVSINGMNGVNSQLKIVGGYTQPPAAGPSYWVVGPQLLARVPQEGKEGSMTTPKFTDKNGGYVTLSSVPLGTALPEAEARAWFDSDDAKTSLQILKSLEIK